MTKQYLSQRLKKLHLVIFQVEEGLLITLLFLMIVTAVVQILLRNLFGGGLIWAEGLSRTLVLWVTLVGAMIGSRSEKHIRIDLLAHYLKDNIRRWVAAVADLFAGLASGVAGFFSYKFILLEYEFSNIGFAQVPSWICGAIIPFAFCVISLRYIIASTLNLISNRIKA